MDLAHREPPAPQPLPVDLAELGVAVAVGMALKVLEVQEFERHAGLAALGVEVDAVGLRACPLRSHRRRSPVESRLEGRVGHRLDARPV